MKILTNWFDPQRIHLHEMQNEPTNWCQSAESFYFAPIVPVTVRMNRIWHSLMFYRPGCIQVRDSCAEDMSGFKSWTKYSPCFVNREKVIWLCGKPVGGRYGFEMKIKEQNRTQMTGRHSANERNPECTHTNRMITTNNPSSRVD